MTLVQQVLRRILALPIQLKHIYTIWTVTILILIIFLVTLNLPFDFIKSFKAFVRITDSHTDFGLILNTPSCKIPKFDPYDKTIKDLITARKPYICRGDAVFLVTQPNSTVILNKQVLKTVYNVPPENMSCTYKAIYRDKEHISENFIRYGDSKQLRFGIPLGEEFLKVQCKLGKKSFTQYLPLVPIKPEVEKRTSEVELKGAEMMNVILIGIDSVSKLNFLRHFKKTHTFLVENMSAFDMKGYTKVGDNTFPNLVPLLTGHFVEYYWNESMRNKMVFDNLDFIWKTYANSGYRTFYAEDSPFTGTFNYLKRGFLHPPTDYYFRTMGLAIQKSDLRKKGKSYCLNDQLETEILYGYLTDFVKTMGNRSHFAFTMVSTLTHDRLNDAGYCDEPTYNLLKGLWESGVMNRSMVIIFSDHGIRFGDIRKRYIGKVEERMPFMYLTLPEWFLEKHDDISTNLKANQNRLITLFDLHATLRHLLDIAKPNTKDSINSTSGLSLFGEIPEHRTCEMANILPHWCSCQVYRQVSTTELIVTKAASEIANSINEQLKKFAGACAHLHEDKIIDARIGQVNDKVLKFLNRKDILNRHAVHGVKIDAVVDLLLTLRTSPGGGIFESTVRQHAASGKFEVLGISRINMYGDQSICIDSQVLKKFCFCK